MRGPLPPSTRSQSAPVPATLLAAALLCAPLAAQRPPTNGPATNDPGWHALVGADVVVEPGRRIEGATLVLRRGRVVSVEPGGAVPAGATAHDCRGLVLYPGLVEPYLTVDVPAPESDGATAHWHAAVLARRSALDGDGVPQKEREALRALGFTSAAIAPTGGVLKGTAAVVHLDEPADGERAEVLRETAYLLASLQRSLGAGPSSQMGAIAILRQALADADWYERCHSAAAQYAGLRAELPAANADLEVLVARRATPMAFDVEDELEVLRCARVAAEFGRSGFVLGSGMEFRRLGAVAATGLPIVVPVHFPEVPDVSTLAKAEQVSLRQLQSWEQAPTNLARLLAVGARVALTTARLPDKKDFRARLRDAMACGVSAEQALAALTTTPAALLGLEGEIGALLPGHRADVVAVAGDLFDPKARIRAVWVGGREHEVTAPEPDDFDGRWTLTIARPTPVTATMAIAAGKVAVEVGDEKVEARAVEQDGPRLEFVLASRAGGGDGTHWLRLRLRPDGIAGTLYAADGAHWPVTATRADAAPDGDAAAPGDDDDDDDETKPAAITDLQPLPTPLGGFGRTAPPTAQDAVFAGATLWTCGPAGVVVGSLHVRDGRIVYAGPAAGMPAPAAGTAVIDCTGKHITPGIIDCHSHTGISRGVNEGGEAVTAEVRIEDVLDPDDANWYRQLAGGVTTVNQLHGSANAIGGQSNTVKLRWGVADPEAMVFTGHVPGIKFALGENPRRANGRERSDRYPGTRMGVEALIRDRLLAAADYARRVQAYRALPPRERAAVVPVRRDLELEALAEVLAGERRVHCHSYRQDEIFMLCGVAREFGFRIGTFQHVLEGYKVAEEIAVAAVGASAFSDWWGYKFEVYDAIPENGAIMHEVGVCVSFNSDSDEHARRLNTEAGKAVKYGGVAAEEALKFVTLNPAVQLGIDDRVGSLEPGKDADFAIWSDHPLGYAAVCEATWIDGAPQFTRSADRELRRAAALERQRLLQKALAAKKPGGDGGGRRGRDAYWAAEDDTEHYCCRDCEGGRK